jgi:HemK-related putative methylase
MIYFLFFRCGSGCVIVFLSNILGPQKVYYLATDINPYALKAAYKLSHKNRAEIELVQCDLTKGIHAPFDIILFNPPYVATSEEEIQYRSNWISKSWAGGIDGTSVFSFFLKDLPRVLSIPGVCYVVLISENQPHKWVHFIEEEYHFECKVGFSLLFSYYLN